jgi:rubredoxin
MFIISILIVACLAFQSEGFKLQRSYNNRITKHQSLSMTNTEEAPTPTQIKITEIYSQPKVTESTEVVVPDYSNETEEETYKRTKLAEIAEKQALEVFVSRNTGKYECQSCGYIYSEAIGNAKYNIMAGTPFLEIEKFRCPQCGANKKYFIAETEILSGFKENLNYGIGGNSMTGIYICICICVVML